MKNFLKSKKFIFIASAIVLVILGTALFGKENGKERVTAQIGDVVQEVAATGKVEPNQSVDLGFDKSGRVGAVYVVVGDLVEKGELLASIESLETSSEINRAEAVLQEEIIKLRELKNTAPSSYNDAYKNLAIAIREGFNSADNAVRNRADQFFKNVPSSPRFEVSFTDGNFIHYFEVSSEVRTDLNSRRKDLESKLNDWEQRIQSESYTDITAEALRSVEILKETSIFLDRVAGAINSFTPAEFAYETTVNTYKTTIASARTEVSNAVSGVVSARDKLNSAPKTTDGGEFESVLAQEAKVAQANASLASLEASLSKSAIRAPFTGIVTVQDAKVGSAVSAGEILISMTSRQDSYIEANISEINIDKIAVGNPATISFDAFPGEDFKGFVSFIEPGDVIVEGVVNYKIRLEIENFDERIKNGLTANIKIETSKKEGVLSVPLYAIVEEEGNTFVNKVVGNKVEKTPVSVGFSGSNGTVEVLEGLREGDIIEF